MKYILLIAFFILAYVALEKLTGNDARYNAHVCATYGYEPDCKTHLAERTE